MVSPPKMQLQRILAFGVHMLSTRRVPSRHMVPGQGFVEVMGMLIVTGCTRFWPDSLVCSWLQLLEYSLINASGVGMGDALQYVTLGKRRCGQWHGGCTRFWPGMLAIATSRTDVFLQWGYQTPLPVEISCGVLVVSKNMQVVRASEIGAAPSEGLTCGHQRAGELGAKSPGSKLGSIVLSGALPGAGRHAGGLPEERSEQRPLAELSLLTPLGALPDGGC
eukprot:TRINITY_DN13688_c1_g1_i1.p1 TRINITY_DN13688_c1_g1~~TRINITY_DN13688_c1_g1_i1.p1  ORF type:complete len:221 (-),score=8.37 TRINITY_DN13688_c1_g1_i1:520-1182(-)